MKEFNLETKIADLYKDLSYRVVSCLINENITDVRKLLSYTSQELLRIPNFGRVSLKELEDYLAKRDMKLGSIPKPKPKKEPKPKGPQWFWASINKPSIGEKVIFWTAHGECFIGIFSPEMGWLTPLPQNIRQNWDTFIKVTANVSRWTPVPVPPHTP
jgi:hypothetical protein